MLNEKNYEINRIAFIDGFRGIAIILVFLFHVNLLSSGFSGVEMFFVISGFIVTYTLINEWNIFSNISITNFFKRRISRIYPCLITVTIITLIVFIKFPLISIKNRVFYEAVSTSIGLENFYQILHNLSYWEQ